MNRHVHELRDVNAMALMVAVALCLLMLFSVTGAWAQTPIVSGSVGVKGAIGGNHIKGSDNLGSYEQALSADENAYPFYRDTGGTGGGGGIFGEVRFFNEHLAIEADCLLDANKNWYAISNDGVKMDYVMKYTVLKIPLLLKANFLTGKMRFGVGFGPEFRIGLRAKPGIEIIDGESFLPDAGVAAFETMTSAEKRNDIALAWDVSLAFAAKYIEITLDLRLAYNLTWPTQYEERVNIVPEGQDWFFTFQAGHLAEGRLLLGVAYRFPGQLP